MELFLAFKNYLKENEKPTVKIFKNFKMAISNNGTVQPHS